MTRQDNEQNEEPKNAHQAESLEPTAFVEHVFYDSALMIFFSTIYNFLPYLQAGEFKNTFAKALNVSFSAFMTALVLAFIYQFFYFKPVKKLFIVITALIPMIFSVANVVLKAIFGMGFGFVVMDIIAGTNLGEVEGFIQLYLDEKFIGYILLGLSPFILAFCFRKHIRKFAVYLARNPRYIIVFVVLWALIIQINLGKVFGNSYESPIISMFRYAKTYIKGKFYGGSIYEEGAFRAEITRNDSSIPNIVLVIGESASSDYMGIYGHKIPNTPACETWENKGNLAVFHNVITPRPSTYYAVPMMISFMAYDAPELTDHTANNISEIFQQCGYKTFWISNQERDTNGSLYTTFTSDYLSDYSHYHSGSRFNIESSKTLSNFDGLVAADFLNNLKKERKAEAKGFYVLHLQGSHYAYNLRYPPQFQRWNSIDLLDEPLQEDKKQNVADFINSMYYTDHLLDVMMQKLNDDESILIYVSDHGEELGQNGKYRTHSNTEAVSQSMFRIPFLIWMSDKFIANKPEKAAQIKEAAVKHNPWMTDSLPHLILDLADIETTQYKPENSLINPAFQLKDRKIFGIKFEDLEP